MSCLQVLLAVIFSAVGGDRPRMRKCNHRVYPDALWLDSRGDWSFDYIK